MSSPDLGSSAQPGATVTGGDVPPQLFRQELDEIEWGAKNNERYDLATEFDVREMTGSNGPLTDIDRRAESDRTNEFAIELDVNEIRSELTVSNAQLDKTGINRQLTDIERRAENDRENHLANRTEISEQLTESGVSAADNRQARIAAKTIETRERLEAAHDANTVSQDHYIGHNLALPGY